MALDLLNEWKYLNTIRAKGGGNKVWAEQQAQKYGISLDHMPSPASTNVANREAMKNANKGKTLNNQQPGTARGINIASLLPMVFVLFVLKMIFGR
jgi:hypothetical protein